MDERVGAFGPGWSTFLDLAAEAETGARLLVSFPDGHRERYGQNADGSWVAGPGSASVLRSVGGGGWELERPDHTVYVFDDDGLPVALRDAWGHELTLERDPVSGLVEEVTSEPSGRTMTLTWDSDGPGGADVVTSAATDPPETSGTAPVWTYGHDAAGRLAEVCAPGEPEPDAQCTRYGYHSSSTSTSSEAVGKLHTITRQEGNVAVELDYRSDGVVAWVENGEGDRWSFVDTDDRAEGTYHPLDGAVLGGAPAAIGANATVTVDVAGVGGVPASGVQAVVVDVAAAGSAAGYLSVRPNGMPEVASVSTMNYISEPRSNLLTVAVGDDGNIAVTNHGPAVFTGFEMVGWYGAAGTPDGSVYVPVATSRVYDSRVSGAGGAIGAGATRDVGVLGEGGIPTEGVTAVVYALTGISPTVTTNMTAYAKGVSRPGISTLSIAPSRIADNLHVTAVGTDGKITLWNQSGSIDVVVDVVGYFADPDLHDGSVFRPVTPARLVNTSSGSGAQYEGSPWPAGGTRSVSVAGEATIPGQGVTAFVGDAQNLGPPVDNAMSTTAAGTTSNGFTARGLAGTNVGNSIYVGVGGSGTFDLRSNAAANVAVDAAGYFTPVPRTTIVTDPRDNTIEYRYDALGRLTGRIDEDGYQTAWAYNDKGFVSSMRDAVGEGHVYSYDDDGHLTADKLVRYRGGPESQIQDWESTTYHGYVEDPANTARDGKLAWTADGRSADADDTTYRTTYTYDSQGLLTSVLGPALSEGGTGAGVTKTYTDGSAATAGCPTPLAVGPAGFLATETDAAGLTTTYCYDAQGDLREVHHPSGLVDRYAYDDLGRAETHTVVSDSYPSGVTTTKEYDAKGRVVRELGPAVSSLVTGGHTHRKDTHTTYTPNGNVDRVTLADAETDDERWLESTYDDADRLAETVDSAGRTTEQLYDQNGNVSHHRGVDGQWVHYRRDDRNQVIKVMALDAYVDPVGAPNDFRDVVFALYEYDAKGRPYAQVNATGETLFARWAPDGQLEHSTARLHQDADPDTGLPAGPERTVLTTAAQYDKVGNPVRSFAPSNVGQVDEFTGSALGAGWLTTGSWSVAGGEASASAAGALAWRPGAVDGQVGLTVGGSPSLSVLFRVEDASNYYELAREGNQFVAYKVTDGVADDFETVSGPALSEGDRVEVNFTGDRLRVFQNAVLVVETTIPADTAGTGAGVISTAAGQSAERFRFDAYTRTESTFDPYGRMVASTADPGGAELSTEMVLLPDGRPSTVTVSGGADPTQVAETRFGYSPTTGWLTSTDEVVSRTATPNPEGEPTITETVAHTANTYDQRGLLTQVVSPELAQTNYLYDEVGQLARETGPARDVEGYGQSPQPGVRPVVTYEHNAFGDRTIVQDPVGRQTIASLDERGFPVSVTLPSYTAPGTSTPVTRTITAEYDDAGRVTAQTDPLGETTELTYNTVGQLIARTDPAAGNDTAGVWRYVYDDAGRLLEQRDPTGAVTRQRWDDLGRVTGAEEIVRQPALASHVTGITRGDAGAALRSRTAEGVVFTATYDLAGRLTGRADADGNDTLHAYDGLGRLAATTSPDGRRVEQRYDLLGNTTGQLFYSAADALLGQAAYTYDKEGRLLTEASPRGVAEGYAAGYQYDAAGQLKQRTTPVAPGQSILETWGYDALGGATRYTDGRNNTTWQTYNSMDLPEDAIEPAAGPHTTEAQRRWRSIYDANGRVTSQQSPGGVTVTSTYDELGRLASQAGSGAQAATTTRTFDHDPVGNLLSGSLNGGGTQSFTYDDRGLMLSSTGVSGDSSFAYNGDGQLTSQTDSSGTTGWAYDDRGLPESMTSTLAGTADYAFDESGRPESVDYGSGTTRTYTYDDWGRLDTDQLATGSTVLYGLDYGYDDDGNVTSKTVTGTGVPAAGTNQYTYDRASRLTSWTRPGGPTETFGWDAASNRTQAGATTAVYDEQNRLTTLDGPGAQVVNTWLANGTLDTQSTARRVGLVVADPSSLTGAETALQSDLEASSEATSIVVDDDATVPTSGVDVFVISPDVDTTALGTKYRDVAVPVVTFAAGTWQANGLTSSAATSTSGASAHVAASGHQVAAGNTGTVALLTSTDTINGVPASGLGTGATQIWNASSTSTDAVVAVYDTNSATPGGTAAGRRVTIGLSAGAIGKLNADGRAVIDAAIAWADDNTTTTFGSADFDFDAFEQLSKITVPGGSASTYDYDPVGRRLSSPTGTLSYAGGSLRPSSDGAHRYQHGTMGVSAVDDLVAGGGTWAHTDAHTDIVASFTTGATTLGGAQAFDPWGQPLGTSGTALPLGYQSERQDLPGGLIGMGVREYDPSTGTFISHDPVADPAVPNGYSYTSANPLGATDPTGMFEGPKAMRRVPRLPTGWAGKVAGAVTGAVARGGGWGFKGLVGVAGILLVVPGDKACPAGGCGSDIKRVHASRRWEKSSTGRYQGQAERYARAEWNSIEAYRFRLARERNPWDDLCTHVPAACPPSGDPNNPTPRPGLGNGNGGNGPSGGSRGPSQPQTKCNPTCTDPRNLTNLPPAVDTDSAANIKEDGCASGNRPGPCGSDIPLPTTDVTAQPPPTTTPLVPEIAVHQAGDDTTAGPGQIPDLERPQQRVGDNECGFATGKGSVGWGDLADVIWQADPLTGCGPGGAPGSGAGSPTGAPTAVSLPTTDVRLSQHSVNDALEIVESMQGDGWVGDPIDVVRMPDGGLTAIDNTRVVAAHEAGINVRATIHGFDELLPDEYIGRFTTPKGGAPSTWGEAIMNRIGRQKSAYRTRWPYGSPFTGWDGA